MASLTTNPILPMLQGRFSAARLERFWAKVKIGAPDECWDWQASTNTYGYGRFKLASHEAVAAHRVALIAATQTEPENALVLHSCDRPVCCNPNHLRFGNHADNNADRMARNRWIPIGLAGEANPRAKLKAHHITVIVERMRAGWNNTRIAADLPVTHGMVSRIRLGLSWRNEAEALGWIVERQAA